MEFNGKKILPLESDEAVAARQEALDSLLAFIEKLEKEGKENQLNSRGSYPEKYGLPLIEADKYKCDPKPSMYVMHEDDMGKVLRVKLQIVEGLYGEGMLFLPKDYAPTDKRPLILSLHGGSGTPEMASEGWELSSNYSAQTRRVLDKGAIVFAPFMIVGSSPHLYQKLKYDEVELDHRLERYGWSRLALGVTFMMRAIDCFTAFPGVDPEKVGMIGMSWGSRFSVLTAEFDERVKRVYGSCYLEFGEEAARICPRYMVIEEGMWDFALTPHMVAELPKLYDGYMKARATDKLRINFHGGDHMLDKDNRMLDWLFDPFFED